MKKRLARIGIVISVFIVALVAFGVMLNRNNINVIADTGNPHQPTLSFELYGRRVNTLFGYKQEMDVPSVRDTMLPLNDAGEAVLYVEPYNEDIMSIAYEIQTLDGASVISEGELEYKENEALVLELGSSVAPGIEQVLHITVQLDSEKLLHYYTRVMKLEESDSSNLFQFVQTFYESALAKNGAAIEESLESNGEGENSTLQHVTIHSSLEQVMWGELKPVLNGEVHWSVKESNSVFTAIELKYQVMCASQEDPELMEFYDVEEFFKVRYEKDKDTIYLLQYDRVIAEVKEAENFMITEQGIDLGISSGDVEVMKSKDEKTIAFVNERQLFSYDVEDEVLHSIFGFDQGVTNDIRNKNDSHDIRILSVDNNGNIAFSLYGYMNRGEHEGSVGTVIYYYDVEESILEEKVFIEETHSFATMEEELRNGFYYNAKEELLYVLAQEALYEVNIQEGTQEKLSNDTDSFQYKISENGEEIIYANEKSGMEKELVYQNFTTGKEVRVEAKDGETIHPLGFIGEDFVYGFAKEIDQSESDAVVFQRLVIGNEKDESLTVYEREGQWITSVILEENRVVMDMAVEQNGSYVFVEQEFLTSSTEDEDEVDVESYITEAKQKQYRIIADGIEKDVSVEHRSPMVILNEDALQISFEEKELASEKSKYYVYAYGEIIGSFDNAGEAVVLADESKGSVINENQVYIWQSGNRNLSYSLSNEDELQQRIAAGTPIIDLLKELGNDALIEYSGATVEEMFYIINQERPVGAYLSDGQWVLLVGYNSSDKVSYLDQSGRSGSVDASELTNRVVRLVGEGNL